MIFDHPTFIFIHKSNLGRLKFIQSPSSINITSAGTHTKSNTMTIPNIFTFLRISSNQDFIKILGFFMMLLSVFCEKFINSLISHSFSITSPAF
jgi:hypothetical protein